MKDSRFPITFFHMLFMEESSESCVPAMEMATEDQNQDNVSRKLIKIQNIVEKKEEDRISALPDFLLLEILSRLPSTKGAIRTGTLSKRWKSIWTLLPILIFRCRDVETTTTSDYVSFVDKTLSQCRQLRLKKLVLDTYSDSQFHSRLKNWIHYAISCNVEELLISLHASSFTNLKLQFCTINPTGAISWKNLRSLCISDAKLDEDLIENILSDHFPNSPLLKTFVLISSYGYTLLNITSESVKKLVIIEYPQLYEGDTIKVNAPNILSLSIQDFWLDDITYEEEEEKMPKRFILDLGHVVSRLKAKDFDFPSNIVKFLDEIWTEIKDQWGFEFIFSY
ncbi:hypothetical protein LXL04_027369 [Taraxacum kok-saghyz]